MAFLDDTTLLSRICKTDEERQALNNIFMFCEGLSDRLAQLEEDCPNCKGVGGFYDAGEGTEDRCETCEGSGKVPICYLPEWFVFWVFAIRISGEVLNCKDSETCRIVACPDGDIVFTAQQNNLWKLSKTQESK